MISCFIRFLVTHQRPPVARRVQVQLIFFTLMSVSAHAETTPSFFVRSTQPQGRLALYAATNAPLEAIAWLSADAVLAVIGELTDAPWTPVEAPDAVTVCIYRDLVRDQQFHISNSSR